MGEDVYRVGGMTCAHCVAAVTNEVGKIPGAETVDVDISSGRLVVRGEGIKYEDVRAAVEEAGYSVL